MVSHTASPYLFTFSQAYMAKITSCLLSAGGYYVLVQFFTSINLLRWFKTDMHLEKSENMTCSGPSTFTPCKEKS